MVQLNVSGKNISQYSIEDCDILLTEMSELRNQIKSLSNKILTEKIGEKFLLDNIELYASIYGELGEEDIKKLFSQKSSFKEQYSRNHSLPENLEQDYQQYFGLSNNLTFEQLDQLKRLIVSLKQLLIEQEEEKEKNKVLNMNNNTLLEVAELPDLNGHIGNTKYVAEQLMPFLNQLNEQGLTNQLANDTMKLVNDQEVNDFLGERNIFVFLNELYTTKKVEYYLQLLQSVTEIPDEYNDKSIKFFLEDINNRVNDDIEQSISDIINEIQQISPCFSEGISISPELPLAKINNLFNVYGISDGKNNFESLYQLRVVWKVIQNEFQKIADTSLHRKVGKTFIHRNTKSKSYVYDLLQTNKEVFEQKILSKVLGSNYQYQGLSKFTLDELYDVLEESIKYESPNDLLLGLGHNISSVDFDFVVGSEEREFYGIENSEKNEYELNKKFPKVKYLTHIFQEEGINTKFDFVQTLNGRYKYVYLSDFDKTLVISDDYGFGTYIYDGEINIDLFAENNMRDIVDSHKFTMIKFLTDQDPEIWKEKILTALQKENLKYDAEISLQYKKQSVEIMLDLYHNCDFNIKDYPTEGFKKFINDWNKYIDSKKYGDKYTGDLERKYQCYIDCNKKPLDSLYLYSSMSTNNKNNPLSISVYLYELLEKADLSYIQHEQVVTLNGSTYYNDIIALVLEYLSTNNISEKNKKEQEIEKRFNVLISRNIGDIYIRELLEKIYLHYTNEELEELYAKFQGDNDTCESFKGLELRNATCLRTIKGLVGHDCITSNRNIDFEELIELNSLRNQCMRIFVSEPLTENQIDNLIYDFESFHNGLFSQAFGDFYNFYIYIGGDIEDVNNAEDVNIHRYINKVFIANELVNNIALTETFKNQIDFTNWSEDDLLSIINASTNIIKSSLPKDKISLKGIKSNYNGDQELYSIMRKLTGVSVIYKDDIIDEGSIRTIISSHRVDYYRISALKEYFNRLGYNIISQPFNEIDTTPDNFNDTAKVVNQPGTSESNTPEVETIVVEKQDNKVKIDKILEHVNNEEEKVKSGIEQVKDIIENKSSTRNKIKRITTLLKNMEETELTLIVSKIDAYMYPKQGKIKILSQILGKSIAHDNIKFEIVIKDFLLGKGIINNATYSTISELLVNKNIAI